MILYYIIRLYFNQRENRLSNNQTNNNKNEKKTKERERECVFCERERERERHHQQQQQENVGKTRKRNVQARYKEQKKRDITEWFTTHY